MMVTGCSEHRINWSVKIGEKGHGFSQEAFKSIGTLVFQRGDDVYSKEESLGLAEQLFSEQGLYCAPSHLCRPQGTRIYRDSSRLFGHQKSTAVLTNNQSHVPALERTLRKATQMKMEGAYLHHYAKFGVDDEHFADTFIRCEETLAAYKSL